MYISIKPPPPKLPALGRVIANEKPTATAASTAFPPLFKISIPISDDRLFCETTIPEEPIVG